MREVRGNEGRERERRGGTGRDDFDVVEGKEEEGKGREWRGGDGMGGEERGWRREEGWESGEKKGRKEGRGEDRGG